MSCIDISSSLFDSYNNRPYHNKRHLKQVLYSREHWTKTQEFAIMFHDIVYEPMSTNNEFLSALIAVGYARDYTDVDQQKVKEIILATKKHTRTGDSEIDLVLDADCSILASSKSEYMSYMNGIRKEYFMVSDEEYKKGRLAFLKGFTGFITREYSALDYKAEKNIEFEIGLLECI